MVHGLIDGLIVGLIIFVAVGLGCWSESPLKNGIISGSIGGLISGLIRGALSGKQFVGALTFGLIVGLIGGLGIGSLNHISLVETIGWKWNQFWKRAISGSIVGLIFGLISGLVLELSGEARYEVIVGPESVLVYGLGLLGCGLMFGLIVGLSIGLIGGFTDRVKVGKAFPNQGIKLSLKNSSAVFLVTCLTMGLIPVLVGGLSKEGLYSGLIDGLRFGSIFGLIAALNRGGSAVIKHYALRLTLWLKGYTPFNFIKFLDHCAKLIFLKKVGGGYIFIHRMLLEYFADLTPQSTRAEDGKAGSVRP